MFMHFEQNAIKVLNFNLNSPDLNQIENMWWIVKTKVFKNGPFGSKEELQKQFKLKWKKMQINMHKLNKINAKENTRTKKPIISKDKANSSQKPSYLHNVQTLQNNIEFYKKNFFLTKN
ncbi:hypothetical protein RFI_19302 [Reticulomyxa filosa]|uniref:Tc1-like transposase DDE domain-containing protein n=1 Tax=Reticulomyxa filosa TaxID=46433 RepID=X6MY33_RETFI|nr:hypothetical protein RFI_19302 [Reticulomyxa filosa]|eukprot:ETO17990.1 hypothetical protein RFI_19302 [Reticulomyxa filosa]